MAPVATRMVDDALWALVGGKEPSQSEVSASDDAKLGRDHKRVAKKRGVSDRAKAMVVRTSDRFGLWARLSFIFILSASALWGGYALGISRSGTGADLASEEMRGLATTLETGGLASLNAVEEQAQTLLETSPALGPILDGVLAETYAQRFRHFGGGKSARAQARQKISALNGQRPTVEFLSAMVTVSTSAVDRRLIDAELVETLQRYPRFSQSLDLARKSRKSRRPEPRRDPRSLPGLCNQYAKPWGASRVGAVVRRT